RSAKVSKGFEPPNLQVLSSQRIYLVWRYRLERELGLQELVGSFHMGTLRETLTKGTKGALHLGPERPRVYSDLTSEEKDRFVTAVKLNRGLRDSNYDQLYAYLKQHEGAGAASYGGAQNRVGYANSVYFKDKMMLMQAQENGVVLDEELILFIAGGQDNIVDEDMDEQPIQDLALNVDNVFQADECDAFDSDDDEAPTAQTMFMENLSSADHIYDKAGPSYDLDILSEYVKDNAVPVVQSNVSAVPNDAYMMILNDMHEPPV
nr:retrovirus-related Pol polyprotein from transposon TNT 1-94 [Tanacetum cinerariifolium]